jgi:hypothetical protein
MFAKKCIESKNVLCSCLVLIFVLVSYSTGNSAPFQNPTTFRCIKGWHGEKRCMEKNKKKIEYTHDGVDIVGCPGDKSIDGAEVRPYMEGKVEEIAKHKDSRSVNRKTWKEIGTWSLTVQ